MKKLSKGNIVYLSILTFLSLFHLLLLILLIDMFNIRTFGIVLSFVIYFLMVWTFVLLMNKKWFFKVINGLTALVLIILLFNISAPLTKQVKAVDYKNPFKTEVMEVEGGKIQGVLNKEQDVEIYTGIPYARAPIGEYRWKEPGPVQSWDDVKDCSYFAPKAMQDKDNWFVDTGTRFVLERGWHLDYHSYTSEAMSEDCLYLNVFKPKNASMNTPVLVYYHGGSLMGGSTSFDDYNGTELARRGIIFVSVAYRVGVFGYFAHQSLIDESPNKTTGCYGLLDQIEGLKWVNNNIYRFNGDKNNITIAGESAGSSSVSAICSSPLASGLFKRAIGESSSLATKVPPHTYRSLEDGLKMGQDIQKEFKCNSMEELRKIPAEKLINTKYKNNSLCVDGHYALLKSPYEVYRDKENNEEALLNGCNMNEAEAFTIPMYLTSGQPNKSNWKKRLKDTFGDYADKFIALYPDVKTDGDAYKAFNEIISAYWFVYPHHSWNKLMVQNDKPVYVYLFTKTNGYMSTWHSGEMIYAYNNIKNSKFQYRYNQSDYVLSDIMASYWVNFVKSGNPNGEGLPNWSLYNLDSGEVQELGLNVGSINDPFSKLYPVFEEFEEYQFTHPKTN